MFLSTWHQHWHLDRDPFACEDADKDLVLCEMISTAVHSAFDRVYGDPRAPAPGIVFGEKGSGKSGMRIAMRSRLAGDQVPGSVPDAGRVRALTSEYVDFDVFLERFRRAVGVGEQPADVARAVAKRWQLADHLDAMLSLGVTRVVDEMLSGSKGTVELSNRQQIDLLLLTALYYDSRTRTVGEAWEELLRRLRFRSRSRVAGAMVRGLLTLFGVVLMGLPVAGSLMDIEFGPGWLWAVPGLVVLLATWGVHAWRRRQLERMARSVSIRILGRDWALLAGFLDRVPEGERNRFVLPTGTDERQRYDLLDRFGALRKVLGYDAWYVLVDRLDEPSALTADGDAGRRFAETLLDHKLLQLPDLALKLFLPIELDRIYRSATPEQLKRMRLDKSNLVETLDWTGQELIEIASYRIRICSSQSEGLSLWSFFAEDLEKDYVRETLERLGTPRYVLGFLSHAFREYARDLPSDLGDDDPRWRIPRAHFDRVRDKWLDRTEVLRRTLNSA